MDKLLEQILVQKMIDEGHISTRSRAIARAGVGGDRRGQSRR